MYQEKFVNQILNDTLKSSDPETVFYCYMILTWEVNTWDWAPLPCVQVLA